VHGTRTADNEGNDMSEGTSGLPGRPPQVDVAALIGRSRIGAFQLGMLLM
jgi:hypothetical protein